METTSQFPSCSFAWSRRSSRRFCLSFQISFSGISSAGVTRLPASQKRENVGAESEFKVNYFYLKISQDLCSEEKECVSPDITTKPKSYRSAVYSTTNSEGTRTEISMNARRQSCIINLVLCMDITRQCLMVGGDLGPGRLAFSHLQFDRLAIILSEFLAFVFLCLSLPLRLHLPPLPISAPSSLLPRKNMRKRQRPTFTPIPLQYKYNPANLPVTSLPCYMTKPTSLINPGVTTRGYRVGWIRL